MNGWTLDDRGICGALTIVGGLLLFLRLSPRIARFAWLGLLAAGMTHAVALNLHGANPNNINYVHYYMGAKYPFPYGEFYKLVQAALGQPQIGIRDLDHPERMVRSELREQRAYYIDLLRDEGARFDPLGPVDDLARQAQGTGAVERESRRILLQGLPADRIEEFRSDVRAAVRGLTWQVLTADFGFNGSPFYALVRHVDPTLHRPFGRSTAYVNLAWQILATFLIAWIAGAALQLEAHARIAIAALLFASLDFVSFALPGLLFGEFWLPIALAVLAMRHRRAVLAGVAIAWASLIKLFPLVLLLPFLVRPRRSRWGWRVVAACTIALAVLGLVSLLSGRSWSDFLHKIVAEFRAPRFAVNAVSRSAGLMAIGIRDAVMTRVLSLAALLVLAAMFLRGDDEEFMAALPRRALVLLAALGFLFDGWLNYYALVPLLLLPFYAREHRVGAAASALVMGLSFLMPDFNHPLLVSSSLLASVKVLPYLLVPAWMVATELRGWRVGRIARRAAIAAASILILATGADAWRVRTVRSYESQAQERSDQGDLPGALEQYHRILRLDPWNAKARMNEAIAWARIGSLEAAEASFARAEALSPDNPAVQHNYARTLLMRGQVDAAGAHLERAQALAPVDVSTLVLLARVRLAQGRPSEARELLGRARELDPGERSIVELLERIGNS